MNRLACGTLCAFLFFGASMSHAVSAAAIAQGFETTETNLAAGALMSLQEGSPNGVELATQDNINQLVGAVGEDALISLEEEDAQNTVEVVTSGITVALVSDINGGITSGDRVTASPIAGIGMKATESSVVVGTAQADLADSSTAQRTVTDSEGEQHTVNVGLLPVQVNVTFYAAPSERSTFLPIFLQDFADGLAGKEVSPVRVIIAALIMLLAFVIIAVLFYASVKSSIISIGRNPLSEKSVQKSLLQIGGIGIVILLLALITIYLILTT